MIYSRPEWRHGGDHSVLFAARPVGGELQTVTNETLDAGYFDPGELPDALLWHHRQRILDALGGVSAVARLQDMVWPCGEMTNREIYESIGRGELSMQELLEQFCEWRRPEKEELPGS
ncbi:MAG: hypothetical protein GY845_21560 [Planctomycetes bacterium]|nr:hypothetical protein [Planctomycetota bacterium]